MGSRVSSRNTRAISSAGPALGDGVPPIRFQRAGPGPPLQVGPGRASSFPAAGVSPQQFEPGGSRTMLVAAHISSSSMPSMTPGPNGPAVVELWVTRDGGRNWIRRAKTRTGSHPSRSTWGAKGLRHLPGRPRRLGPGRPAPRPRRPAADLGRGRRTPPVVQLDRPRSAPGRTPARWRSPGGPPTSTSPPDRSLCFWRADQPGARWQPIAEGRRTWASSSGPFPRLPAFHLHVEAVDSVGHGLGRDHRRGPGHRRSQPAPEPDHRARPERPRRHRPMDLTNAVDSWTIDIDAWTVGHRPCHRRNIPLLARRASIGAARLAVHA